MKLRSCLWLALVLLIGPVYSQQSSPQRLRALAALPDWSGLWETELAAQLDSGDFARSLTPPVAASAQGPPEGVEAAVELAFFKRMVILGTPPYNAEWQKKHAAEVAATAHPGAPVTTRTAKTCAMGFPLILDSPVPEGMFQAMVTPEETLFLFQDGEVRHVYTDGRPHPREEDRWATEMGDSIGHWERLALVIDTIARKAGPLMAVNMPVTGADLSEQAHFIERLRRVDRDTMQDDLTIEDPLRLAHPWQLSFRFRRVTNLDRMIASNCTENDRNPIIDGKVTMAPPKEPQP